MLAKSLAQSKGLAKAGHMHRVVLQGALKALRCATRFVCPWNGPDLQTGFEFPSSPCRAFPIISSLRLLIYRWLRNPPLNVFDAQECLKQYEDQTVSWTRKVFTGGERGWERAGGVLVLGGRDSVT